jgi:hypothetical protein
MKNLKYFFALMLLVFAANSCQNFEDLEADPNLSTAVPPGLVLRGLLKDAYNEPWGDVSRFNQYWCSNYTYYDTNEYNWTTTGLSFTSLKNVLKMEEEATRINLPAGNAYEAMGKFFRAYFFYDMSMKVGDVPLKDALKGAENIAPAYDTQREIFKQILTWLEEANTQLAARVAVADQTLVGFDFYFNGDLSKWQKIVNAFKLRVLVQLSKREAEATELNVRSEFAKIAGDPVKYPVPTSNDDNMNYTYTSIDKYPFNPSNFGFYADRYNTSATYVSNLAALKDPRVFVVAEPARFQLDSMGLTASDFAAYIGAPSDQGLDEMSTLVQKGKISRISKDRYFGSDAGEPCIQVGYAEVCFNIAEGINRGWWAGGDAKAWYEKGITASMVFYSITDATALATYLAAPATGYKGNNTDGLNQILLQRYLALAQHSGYEAYYHWRRTSQPFFYQGGPGTGNSGLIPRRYQYPNTERDNNKTNYQAALTRQFGSTVDDVNKDLWIVK